MHVFRAAVVGAGTMGGEIAQSIASAEIPVVLKDVDSKFVDQGLEKARQVTEGQLGSLVKKEKITSEQAEAQQKATMARITGTTTYDSFGDVDFVIEAVPERMEVKQAVFAELDEFTPGHAILASNTSSLSITEMGEATTRPHKVVGFHFFYPASTLRLIEVIEGDETSEETMQSTANFAQQIRKQPIRCHEAPGFVVNRILNSAVSEIWRVQDEEGVDLKALVEACLVLEEGVAGIKDVDIGMMAGAGIVPGPFARADAQGLDDVLEALERAQGEWGEHFSPQVIRELADAWHNKIDGRLRAVVIASSNPFTFSAGADIKEFTKMKPDAEGADLIESG